MLEFGIKSSGSRGLRCVVHVRRQRSLHPVLHPRYRPSICDRVARTPRASFRAWKQRSNGHGRTPAWKNRRDG